MARIVRLENLQQFTAINVLTDPGAIGGPKIITQCAEITLGWGLESGKIAHNVLHGRYTGEFAGSTANCNAILSALTSGAAWTSLQPFLSNTTGLNQLTIRNLNVRDQPLILNTTGGGNGTSVSAALPSEVALVVTLRTAFTGPQNRGRIYVPGWATNALGAGNVAAAAAVTALNAWASTIAGILQANGGYLFSIGHVARQAYTGSTGTQHPARVDGTVPVTTLAVRDNHWDTNRRRGLK